MFHATVWALLPPVLAIVLALLTKEVYSSLFAGILLGALLAVDFNPVEALDIVVVEGFSASVAAIAGNLCFLVLLGTLVTMIRKSGGSKAFGYWAEKNVKSRTSAQLATFFFGLLIFIDDYFNCLTVGTVMRPLTDSKGISRAKLAYIIDATAAPICIIAPISTWSAAVSGVANDLDIEITGLWLFIQAIPYNFYSLLTIVFVFAIICLNVDYGAMLTAEKKTGLPEDTGTVENIVESEAEDKPRPILADLLVPLIVLITVCIFFIAYVGGYYGETPWCGKENTGDIAAAFGATSTSIALPCGAVIAVLTSCIYFAVRRTIRFKEMAECLPAGFRIMAPGILLLIFAITLKSVTNKLGTADYVQSIMMGHATELYSFLPAVIFLVSIMLAFSTGTSYGTFGVMLPIVTAVFPADSPLLIIGISACLAGAVCGDHCSPISDTTIMAAVGAQADHIEHVSTQLPYALTVAAVSFVTYLIAGFWHSRAGCLGIGVLLLVIFLLFMRRRVAVKGTD